MPSIQSILSFISGAINYAQQVVTSISAAVEGQTFEIPTPPSQFPPAPGNVFDLTNTGTYRVSINPIAFPYSYQTAITYRGERPIGAPSFITVTSDVVLTEDQIISTAAEYGARYSNEIANIEVTGATINQEIV